MSKDPAKEILSFRKGFLEYFKKDNKDLYYYIKDRSVHLWTKDSGQETSRNNIFKLDDTTSITIKVK